MDEQYTLGDFRELTKSLPDSTLINLVEDIGDADEMLCVEFLGVEVGDGRIEINVTIQSLEDEDEE